MLSVARLVSFWRCIPVQYNCQKSSNFQGLSHFSRIFGKNDKIPGFFQAGKTVTIFPGFPGAVGTLIIARVLPVKSMHLAALFDLLVYIAHNIPGNIDTCHFIEVMLYLLLKCDVNL